MREDLWRMYGADPEQYGEKVAEFEDALAEGGEGVVGLHDASRESAWAELGG